MSNKKPTLIAYTVREREGQNAIWTRIGAAWPHGKGTGLSIHLDALPIGDASCSASPRRTPPKRRPSDFPGPSARAAPFHFHHQRRVSS
jgi:hypothetical protein